MRFPSLSIVCWSLAIASSLMAGCRTEQYCTDDLRPSVQITLADAQGIAIADASVRYQVNGGDWQDATCVSADESLCTEWVAGHETEGTYNIEASKEGYETGSATTEVTMTDGDCHVDTQQVSITLNAATGG